MKNLTPRHIEKDESDRLGIKHGWYGIKVNGTLMTGPAPSHADCLKLIDALPMSRTAPPVPLDKVEPRGSPAIRSRGGNGEQPPHGTRIGLSRSAPGRSPPLRGRQDAEMPPDLG